MNLALWIVAGALALVFLVSGALKLTQPKQKLHASGQRWTQDYNAGTIRGNGVLEVLAAIGLIVPALLNVVPVLVPLAALGLVAIMLGAAYTHARRQEYLNVIGNVVLLAAAVVVAWGRFGAVPFTS